MEKTARPSDSIRLFFLWPRLQWGWNTQLYYSKGVYRFEEGVKTGRGRDGFSLKVRGGINEINKAGCLCLSSALSVSPTDINVVLNASLTANEISRKIWRITRRVFLLFSPRQAALSQSAVLIEDIGTMITWLFSPKHIIFISSSVRPLLKFSNKHRQHNIYHDFSHRCCHIIIILIRTGYQVTAASLFRCKSSSLQWFTLERSSFNF